MPPKNGPESLLSPKEVARRLGVCPETVRKMCRSAELPAIKVWRQYRVHPADVPTAEERAFAADLDWVLAVLAAEGKPAPRA